jgi:hypothetical protein
MAMVGVELTPTAASSITEIDIVAESLLLTTSEIRHLPAKARIGPILLKGHSLGYPHRIDDTILPATCS